MVVGILVLGFSSFRVLGFLGFRILGYFSGLYIVNSIKSLKQKKVIEVQISSGFPMEDK